MGQRGLESGAARCLAMVCGAVRCASSPSVTVRCRVGSAWVPHSVGAVECGFLFGRGPIAVP
eukprot:6381827-Pyramimonas_sp.AAC.1